MSQAKARLKYIPCQRPKKKEEVNSSELEESISHVNGLKKELEENNLTEQSNRPKRHLGHNIWFGIMANKKNIERSGFVYTKTKKSVKSVTLIGKRVHKN